MMKTMQLTKEIILDYLTEVKPELEELGITELGLFGSFAKDKANIASDVDITLKTTEKFSNNYKGLEALAFMEDLRQHFTKQFKRNVDIYNTASVTESHKQKILSRVIYV